MPQTKGNRTFQLPEPSGDPIISLAFKAVRPGLERLLGIRKASLLSARAEEAARQSGLPPAQAFLEATLNLLGVECGPGQEAVDRIPATGPLVVVANHPLGGLDGLVLASVLLRARPDVKIFVNYILSQVTALEDMFLYVDPFGGPGAKTRSLAGIRQGLRWLKQGGCLLMFPAGEVSSLDLRLRKVVDRPWTLQAARLVRAAGAAVLPVYFAGRNSGLFQAAGLVHPFLRTALLCRETVRKGPRKVGVVVGSPIPYSRLRDFKRDEEMVAYLRLRAYSLRYRPPARPAEARPKPLGLPAMPPAPEPLAKEIAALDPGRVLTENSDFMVVRAEAFQIPRLLQAIGRQRETTFRLEGEGTGKDTDLDLFDNTYQHLILWHKGNREIAGAYRMGLTDVLLPRFGVHGLYTNTLFDMDPALFRHIGPALELGRSFIYPPYQKRYSALLSLWKGIGAFLAQNPRYTTLYGPVSISAEYNGVSRRYMVEYLSRRRMDTRLAGFVTPKSPPRFKRRHGAELVKDLSSVETIGALAELVRDLEPGNRDVPVLLKHYLRMGGSILGFNVDCAFGNALDGLLVVNMLEADPKVLRRFMGHAQARDYLGFHGRLLDGKDAV
jgi:putative hemolysin